MDVTRFSVRHRGVPVTVTHGGRRLARPIERVDLDRGTTLRGGRWLRLANHTVLDVQTLRAFPMRPWIDYQPGGPFGGLGGGGPARCPDALVRC